jgi:hypothetical protein
MEWLGDWYIMNCKGYGKEMFWSDLRHLPRHLPGGAKEEYKHSQDSQSSGQDLNLGPLNMK